MATEIFRIILGNIPAWMLILALICSTFSHLRLKRSWPEAILHYSLIFPIGISGLWAGLFHAFFPEIAAQAIGWQTSPFQFEVAMANLGVGIAAIIAARRKSLEMSLGVITVVTVFLWGAAFGHIRQIIEIHNFAWNNAGPMLWTDILIPAVALWAAKSRS